MATEAVTNGCTGACCSAFWLPHTLAEFQAGEKADGGPILEAEQIAGMVIPIGVEEANERRQAAGDRSRTFDPDDPRGLDGHIFTCRHWDPETRLCGIYETRPRMCREYPYGAVCSADDCTCTDGGEA